jgi:mRNA interferase RelE/StbE
MVVEFDKSFDKSLDKIKDKSLFPKIEKAIIALENASSLNEIASIKKLSGFKVYYRYRLGDY